MMTDLEIMDRLGNVVKETFAGARGMVIQAGTTADDVPGWDSLNHALFLMNVERAFKLEFEPADVIELENIGQLAALIERLLGDDGRQ